MSFSCKSLSLLKTADMRKILNKAQSNIHTGKQAPRTLEDPREPRTLEKPEPLRTQDP